MAFQSYSGPLNLTIHMTDQQGDVVDAVLVPFGGSSNGINNLQVNSSGHTTGTFSMTGGIMVTVHVAGGDTQSETDSIASVYDVTGLTLQQAIIGNLGIGSASSFNYNFGTSGGQSTLTISSSLSITNFQTPDLPGYFFNGTGTLSANLATNAVANTPPVAHDGGFSMLQGGVLSANLPGTDADNDPLTYNAWVNPQNGSLQVAANGGFTYTPNPGFHGQDSFYYSVTDGKGSTPTGRITIDVGAVNHAPVANSASYNGHWGVPIVQAAPASDPDGNALSYSVISGPAHGSAGLDQNGQFTYTPATGFSGSDQFTYRVSDGSLQSDATISLSIAADRPDLSPGNLSFDGHTASWTVTNAGSDTTSGTTKADVYLTDNPSNLSGKAGTATSISNLFGHGQISQQLDISAAFNGLAPGTHYLTVVTNPDYFDANHTNDKAFLVLVTGSAGGDSLAGGPDPDFLFGMAGDDRLNGGPGNDTLTGGAGDDTFVFAPESGLDAITDFTAGGSVDAVDLNGFASLHGFADVMAHATQSGQDTVIDLGADKLTLKGVAKASLTAADFIVGGWQAQAAGDLDGNGSSDLVWRNSIGTANVWLFAADGSHVQQSFKLPSSWNVTTTADLNGDGHTDLIWRSDSGATDLWFFAADGSHTDRYYDTPAGWQIQASGDLNGDGKTDLIWRSPSGAADIWFMAADGSHTDQEFSIPASWTVQQTLDLNGDGRTDLVWRNNSGATDIWTFAANGSHTDRYFEVPADWQVQASGDFDGNGTTDLIWRNAAGRADIWFYAADGSHTDQEFAIPSNWTPQKMADLNGDGRTDIIWRSDAGPADIWTFAANGSHTDQEFNIPADWHVQASGDFDGNGTTDLIWRNGAGQADIWFYAANGSHTDEAFSIPSDWTPKKTLDLNGDHRTDIVWQSAAGPADIWFFAADGSHTDQYFSVASGWL